MEHIPGGMRYIPTGTSSIRQEWVYSDRKEQYSCRNGTDSSRNKVYSNRNGMYSNWKEEDSSRKISPDTGNIFCSGEKHRAS
jgi:hypothetical protein